jgi:hypothetical protein
VELAEHALNIFGEHEPERICKASYISSCLFTPEDFIEFKKEAERVIDRMTSKLKQEGYLSKDLR